MHEIRAEETEVKLNQLLASSTVLPSTVGPGQLVITCFAAAWSASRLSAITRAR